MNKFLKITSVSVVAIMTANVANAAGYTCEELIEYTSCNPGFYLGNGKCPADDEMYSYSYVEGVCDIEGTYFYGYTKESCEEAATSCYVNEEGVEECYQVGDYVGDTGCMRTHLESGDTELIDASGMECVECNAGHYCPGATEYKHSCAAGTYQPSAKQTSCLTTPAGNYSNVGAVTYTACSAGRYQPNSGQSSCLSCPAGSYCETTGLSAVTDLCADGTYAVGGATTCISCPETNLTDINNKTVVAVTGTTGATMISQCYVDPNAYFQDGKGIYHYKSNCLYNFGFDESNASDEDKEARCNALGGAWEYNDYLETNICRYTGEIDEELCASVGADWGEEDGNCDEETGECETVGVCYAGSWWLYNLTTGEVENFDY